MAAQFVTFMTLLHPGDELVASAHLYGGPITQLTHTLKKLSVVVRFVDPTRLDQWESAIGPRTRALYGETIGNPRGSILDLEPLARLAESRRIPLIVDNTFATPWLCRPLDWGATITLHSATKFLGGHGTSIGGVLAESGRFDYAHFATIAQPSPAYHGLNFYETFGHYGFLMKARAETVRDTGACLSPTNAFLLIQGLETLSVRMERHVRRDGGRPVSVGTSGGGLGGYAGLPEHPQHALAQKYVGAAGAVFAFGLSGKDGRAVGSRDPVAQIFSISRTWGHPQPGDPPRVHHPPAVERRGAGPVRRAAGDDPALRRTGNPGGSAVGPRSGPACDIRLNTADRGPAASLSGRGHDSPGATTESHHRHRRIRPSEGESIRGNLPAARGVPGGAGEPQGEHDPG